MSTTTTPPFKSPGLNTALERELAAGNRVAEDSGGWGTMTRLVMLGEPFKTGQTSPAAGLEYHDVNDPHYWKAELHDPRTRELLACRF